MLVYTPGCTFEIGTVTGVLDCPSLVTTSAEKLLLYQLCVSALMAVPLLPLGGPLLREVTALPVAAVITRLRPPLASGRPPEGQPGAVSRQGAAARGQPPEVSRERSAVRG